MGASEDLEPVSNNYNQLIDYEENSIVYHWSGPYGLLLWE